MGAAPESGKQYPIIITTRDRLEPLLQLVAWLEKIGQKNIWFCDNQSTYPPLIEYLKTTKYQVRFNEINLGHRGPWLSGLVPELGSDEYFVVTDPDVVPCAECPSDVLSVFEAMLDADPNLGKVGFGLKIDDLPEHYEHAANVRLFESQFWSIPYSPGFYRAPIDTTFAMYPPFDGNQSPHHLRSGPPYMARHVPWYQDSANPPADASYYIEHADSLIINWERKVLPATLRAQLLTLAAQQSPQK